MYELQTSVITTNGASFGIRKKGDFRMVLDCFNALDDDELNSAERIYSALIIFYEDFNTIEDIIRNKSCVNELIDNMFTFFNEGKNEEISNTHGHKIVDWEKDSNLICAAINSVANTEIRSLDYLHWWTFLGYYMSIGDCLFTHITSIRYKLAHQQKLEKWEKKFTQDNPQYFNFDFRTQEQKAADEYIRQLWGES